MNLTQRRVRIVLKNPEADLPAVIERLAALGCSAAPIDSDAESDGESRETVALLRAVAVAGFGATNIMLLSVAVWAGADGALRETFHLVSALIAVPVVAYTVQPFLASAFTALRAGRLNMDVPITVAVLLALGLSLFETARGGNQVFFDAAVTLLFFLLIGRYLDHLMRDRARSAVNGLARIAAKGASRLMPDGSLALLALDEIEPGMTLRIAAGERLPSTPGSCAARRTSTARWSRASRCR